MNPLDYNLHPIFVHFPIALLSLYSVLEIISFGRLSRSRVWFYIKLVLVTLDGLAALVAKVLGETAKRLIENKNLIPIDKHELFADLTIAVFGLLAAAYVVKLFRIYLDIKYPGSRNALGQTVFSIQNFVTETPLIKLGALVGLIVITITGALGGSIVYGPDNDPITKFIFHLILP